MADSKAAKVVDEFKSKGAEGSLPNHVKEAIADVEYHHRRQQLLLDASLARGEINQEHYDLHDRRNERFEEVDGEIVSISKNGKNGRLTLTHRPELSPPDKIDMLNLDPANIDLALDPPQKG